jgi:hypothetical protein
MLQSDCQPEVVRSFSVTDVSLEKLSGGNWMVKLALQCAAELVLSRAFFEKRSLFLGTIFYFHLKV